MPLAAGSRQALAPRFWRGVLLLSLWLSAWCWSVVQAATVPVPALERRVTDLTGVLTDTQQTSLERDLYYLEEETGAQVAILMLPSTGDESIEQYAVRVFEQWQLGRAAFSDGVLIVVAHADRAVRIEVGYGLEGAITDVQSGRILRTVVLPLFGEGQFGRGLTAAVYQLSRLIRAEALPPPPPPPEPRRWALWLYVPTVFLGLWFGPLLGAIAAGIYISPVALTALAFLKAVGFGALMGFLMALGGRSGMKGGGRPPGPPRRTTSSPSVRRQPAKRAGRGFSSGGGSSRPSSSSSPSSGGFRGGGGRSGGGGATGRW